MSENIKIKQTSKSEIWIGKHKLYLDDDKTIYITPFGDVSENDGIAIKKGVLKLLDIAAGNVNIIGNLNNVGKPSVKARKIGRDMLENEKVERVALCGMHPVARVIASFVIGVSKKKNIRFFKAKGEALKWFKE